MREGRSCQCTASGYGNVVRAVRWFSVLNLGRLVFKALFRNFLADRGSHRFMGAARHIESDKDVRLQMQELFEDSRVSNLIGRLSWEHGKRRG